MSLRLARLGRARSSGREYTGRSGRATHTPQATIRTAGENGWQRERQMGDAAPTSRDAKRHAEPAQEFSPPVERSGEKRNFLQRAAFQDARSLFAARRPLLSSGTRRGERV